MGCIQIALVALAVVLVILFFYAIKAAIYGLVGALACGILGAIFKGREGLQIGAIVGFGIGVLWVVFL